MDKKKNFLRRKIRTRARIHGTSQRPRLSVFRSNKHIYGQLIDDDKKTVLVSASDQAIKKNKGIKKTELAREVGKLLAKKALELKIKKVVFERGGYKFHGRVKQLAQGAREGKLEF